MSQRAKIILLFVTIAWAGPAVARAETYKDPAGAVCVGTAGSSANACASVLAVTQGGCTYGALIAIGVGDNTSCQSWYGGTEAYGELAAVGLMGSDSYGQIAGVSDGDARANFVAAGAGNTNAPVGVSVTGSNTYSYDIVDVSGTGNTDGGNCQYVLSTRCQAGIAASGTGNADASNPCFLYVGGWEIPCGAAIAASGTGDATASEGRSGIAIAPTGNAQGTWIAVGKHATRDSLVTTNNEDPTTAQGAHDFTTDMYGNSTVDNFIRTYALAAAQARRQLGIEDSVHELAADVDVQVRDLANQIILTQIRGTLQPHLDVVNGYVDAVEQAATCPANVCNTRSWYDDPHQEYKKLNEQEKRVCRRRAQQCYNTQHTSSQAHENAQRYYGRSARNDISDAFRHCFWSTLLAELGDLSFAWDFTRAHEYGHPSNPPKELDMDLHNNAEGLYTWSPRDGYALHAHVCKAMAEEGQLWCIYRGNVSGC